MHARISRERKKKRKTKRGFDKKSITHIIEGTNTLTRTTKKNSHFIISSVNKFIVYRHFTEYDYWIFFSA